MQKALARQLQAMLSKNAVYRLQIHSSNVLKGEAWPFTSL